MVSCLKHHPLGQMIPASVHAVCASLPTIADVIGYEEKHPEVMAQMRFGYPRFVFHEYILRVTEVVGKDRGWKERLVYAACSYGAAERLIAYVGEGDAGIEKEDGFYIAHFPDKAQVRERAKAFLQHTGVSISSRQAEDYLMARGLLDQAQQEAYFEGDAGIYGMQQLRRYVASDALWVANCGMNACYSAISAVRSVQAPKGRRYYLQLGWLYLDTQRILEKLLGDEDELIVLHDVFDREALEAVFAKHGSELAAVITELPTNPLMHTLDVEYMSELCLRHGVARIFDPSMSGLVNVDALPFTDILICSLTKYAAWEGDVMCGMVALNPVSPMAGELADKLVGYLEQPYARDWKRLALQLGRMQQIADRVNANTAAVVAHLESHPEVKAIHHALSPSSAPHYRKLARKPDATGGIITFELRGSLAAFYDKSRIVKGPSFGTHYTMMCPFLYLAHYDLASTDAGRDFLRERGLNPELVRLSVGVEPIEEILRALWGEE